MSFATSPVLVAAYHITEQITDYSTLIKLSITCQLFYDLITYRKRRLADLFDKLEIGVDSHHPILAFSEHVHKAVTLFLPACGSRPECWCNSLRQNFGLVLPNYESSDLTRYGGSRIADEG